LTLAVGILAAGRNCSPKKGFIHGVKLRPPFMRSHKLPKALRELLMIDDPQNAPVTPGVNDHDPVLWRKHIRPLRNCRCFISEATKPLRNKRLRDGVVR
jgi:hypothetical protein